MILKYMKVGIKSEGKFAFLYDIFFDKFLKPMQNKVLEIILNNNCKKIIDIGCGTGSQCKLLSKNGLEVVGIDASKKMIEIAKKKIIDKSEFIIGDITKNIFLNETFDCAIISFVLHPNNQKTIKKILNESKNIVSKNGIIIITDYDFGNGFIGKIASIFIRFIEIFANKSHRLNYFSFLKRGALERILNLEKCKVIESFLFYNGSIKICVIK